MTTAQREQFHDRIRSAMALPGVADATADQLAAWTAEFVRRKTTRPVCGIDDTKRPLEAAGFDVTTTRRPADDAAWRMGVVAIKRA